MQVRGVHELRTTEPVPVPVLPVRLPHLLPGELTVALHSKGDRPMYGPSAGPRAGRTPYNPEEAQ